VPFLYIGGLKDAHAEFCSAEDIVDGVLTGVSYGEIQRQCDSHDLPGCSLGEIVDMADEGKSVADIYFECG